MTDTNLLITAAADHVRALATAAAHELPDDMLSCWTDERLGGHDRIIAMRRYSDNTTDDDIVALPAYHGIAEHVAAWDPISARAAADLLDACADPAGVVPTAVHHRALALARLLTREIRKDTDDDESD